MHQKMITTADIKISVLVDKNDGPQALRAVHRAFGLETLKEGQIQGEKAGWSPMKTVGKKDIAGWCRCFPHGGYFGQ